MRVSLRLSLLGLLVPSILTVAACSKSQVEGPVAKEQSLKDAEAVFQRAVRLDADGLHQEARRAFEEVLDAFQVGASRRPDDAKLHFAIGVVLTHLDRYDEALKAYQEAVRLKPDLAQTHIEIAATLGRLGRNDEGLRAYQEGVRLKPDFAKSHGYLEALLKPRRPITDPTQRLQLQTVSILPPQGKNWLIFSQSASHVKFTKSTTKGPHHIVMASLETETRRDLTFKTRKEFSQHIRQELDWFRAFGSFFSYNVSEQNCLERDCVRVDFTIETSGKPYAPGDIYILTGREYYLLLPDSPGVIVKLSYSQRFRKGDKPLPIEDEVEASFKSLVFTSIRAEDKLTQEIPRGSRVLVRKSPAEP